MVSRSEFYDYESYVKKNFRGFRPRPTTPSRRKNVIGGKNGILNPGSPRKT